MKTEKETSNVILEDGNEVQVNLHYDIEIPIREQEPFKNMSDDEINDWFKDAVKRAYVDGPKEDADLWNNMSIKEKNSRYSKATQKRLDIEYDMNIDEKDKPAYSGPLLEYKIDMPLLEELIKIENIIPDNKKAFYRDVLTFKSKEMKCVELMKKQ